MTNTRGGIFLSYAREDLPDAVRVYRALVETGLDVWFDQIDIMPGQNWRHSITEAIRRSRYAVLLLSSRSVGKHGFVQAEMRKALDVMLETPPGEVFVIPVRLEPCTPLHDILHDLHWIDLHEDWGVGLARLRGTTVVHGDTPTLQATPSPRALLSGFLPNLVRYDGLYRGRERDRPGVALRFFPSGEVTIGDWSREYTQMSINQAVAYGSKKCEYVLDGPFVRFANFMKEQFVFQGLILEDALEFTIQRSNVVVSGETYDLLTSPGINFKFDVFMPEEGQEHA